MLSLALIIANDQVASTAAAAADGRSRNIKKKEQLDLLGGLLLLLRCYEVDITSIDLKVVGACAYLF